MSSSPPQSESSLLAKPSLPAPVPDRPKVIYIMGSGRSGSTILGITLGNCAKIFYAGELHLWLTKSGKSPLPGPGRARFWSSVRDHVAADLSASEARRLEQSTAVFRVDTWRAQRRVRGRYRRVSDDLFRAIARTAEATHVVDSSHFPRRARQLQTLTGIDLYLVFLVRNPQNVVASYSRDNVEFPRFNLVTTNIYLWLTHLLSMSVFLRHPRNRRLLVQYESFVANPEGVLREILDFVGSPASLPDLTSLKTGFAFQGNPLIRTDVVALNSQPPRHARGSRVTALLQSPWTAILSRLRPAGTTTPSPRSDSPRED